MPMTFYYLCLFNIITKAIDIHWRKSRISENKIVTKITSHKNEMTKSYATDEGAR